MGNKVGFRGRTWAREREDDKRKKWRGSGEEEEKKSGEPEGEEGKICYDNGKI